jgi:hypothetical protein
MGQPEDCARHWPKPVAPISQGTLKYLILFRLEIFIVLAVKSWNILIFSLFHF